MSAEEVTALRLNVAEWLARKGLHDIHLAISLQPGCLLLRVDVSVPGDVESMDLARILSDLDIRQLLPASIKARTTEVQTAPSLPLAGNGPSYAGPSSN